MAQGQSRPRGDSPSSLEDFLKTLPGMYLVLAPNFEVVAASDGYLKITRMPCLRAPGTSIFQMLSDPVVPGSNLCLATLKDSLDRVIRAASTDSVSFITAVTAHRISHDSADEAAVLTTARCSEGAERSRHLLMTNTPLLDGAGEIIFILHSLTPQELNSEAETLVLQQKLRDSENRFRDLLEGASDAVLEIAGDGRVLFANRAAVETFGYTLDELLGREMESLVVPKGRLEAHRQHRREYVQNPHMRRMGIGLELPARRKDGANFPVEISLIPVQSGEESSVIAIIHDITARKRTEEKLLQAQKLEALGRLAGGTAHEFNNLAAVIMGSAELILDSGDDKAKHVERIRSAAMRAGGLSRQLLTFGRKQLLSVRILDLNHVLSEIAGSLTDLAPACEMECDFLPGARPLWIKADRLMMEQVITNLITNARDALPNGGKIKLLTRSVEFTDRGENHITDLAPGKYSVLSVSDNGIGMTPEVQARIFEPFFSLKGLAVAQGLGLAMAYGMVTQSGGTISVQSKPGSGTTFNIYLPCPPDHQLHEAGSASPPMVPADCRQTILLLDDQPDLLLLTSEFLRQNGYQVFGADSGLEALHMAANFDGKIDLLITDVILPGMGGLEFARKFRLARPDVPILYISGYTDEIFQGIELDPHEAFLAKPFLTEELALKIRELLQRVKAAISS